LAHFNLGIALHDQGKLQEAIAEYHEAIRLKADHALAHINLGGALHDQGKTEEAIAAYRAAVRLKPDYSVAHYNLGLALKVQRKPAEAVAEFRKARENAPRDSELSRRIDRELPSIDRPTGGSGESSGRRQ
jgi:tetratricopeptide (TPR) repeat protein